jgi:hypothetical protein
LFRTPLASKLVAASLKLRPPADPGHQEAVRREDPLVLRVLPIEPGALPQALQRSFGLLPGASVTDDRRDDRDTAPLVLGLAFLVNFQLVLVASLVSLVCLIRCKPY